MENDPNAENFKEVIKNADLPQFPDPDETYKTLKAKERQPIQHSWKQQGPELICTSCPYNHSQWVGPTKRLTGFDSEGRPTFSDITM